MGGNFATLRPKKQDLPEFWGKISVGWSIKWIERCLTKFNLIDKAVMSVKDICLTARLN